MAATEAADGAATGRAESGLKLAGLGLRGQAPAHALAPTGLGQDSQVAEGPPPSLGARQAGD
eukprot:12867509-Alexandrium_andersonii.AAC.1